VGGIALGIEELQAQVKSGVAITEHEGVVYADFVEENDDAFPLMQSSDINEVYEYLKNHALLES
jgi:hypothetical protein